MIANALKRVEAVLAAQPGGAWFSSKNGKLVRASWADLRNVVKLARQAEELKHRMKRAQKALSGNHAGDARLHYGDDANGDEQCDECEAVAALDLRKPLPTKRGRR